jgi:DNA-binding NtrC family response regulator
MAVNVLLTDDEEGFVDAVARRLGKRGYAIQRAHSGRAALETLDKGADVDVVVLDVRMGGIDGLETLHLIKSAHPGVEVIMLSAYGTPLCIIESRRWGARAFLNKPVNLDELVAAIDDAAAASAARREKKLQQADC